MRTLVLALTAAATFGCDGAAFAPIAETFVIGGAVMDIDGEVVEAESEFSGLTAVITSVDGEFRVELNAEAVKAARLGRGRYRVSTPDRDGVDVAAFRRMLVVEPLIMIEPPSNAPVNRWGALISRTTGGFLDVTESTSESLRAVLYVKADRGAGSSPKVIRVSFWAVPATPEEEWLDEPVDRLLPVPIPRP